MPVIINNTSKKAFGVGHTHYSPVASAMDVGETLALKVKQTPASVRVNWKSS